MTGYLLLKHYNSKPHSKLSRNFLNLDLVSLRLQATNRLNKQRHKIIMRVFELLKWENKTFYCFYKIFILRGNLFISGEVPCVPETGPAILEKLKFCFSKKKKKKAVLQHTC